jgi:hypothetical protein
LVQHRSGSSPEMRARVLSRHCRLAVKLAAAGEPLRPDRVLPLGAIGPALVELATSVPALAAAR